MDAKPEEIEAIDCSEFIQYLFYKLGYQVPDGSINQYYASIPVSTLATGDLVFAERGGKVGHIGVIIRQNDEWTVIEARGGRYGVIETKLDDFLKRKSCGAIKDNMRRFDKTKIRILNYKTLLIYDKLGSIEKKIGEVIKKFDELKGLL